MSMVIGVNKMDVASDVADNFREVFKYFKRKNPPPDFSEVLDVRRLAEDKNFTELKPYPVVAPDVKQVAGLQPIESWQAFTFPNHPGFLFILNPFLPLYDRVWAERCLRDYTRKPNHCNLDAHNETLAASRSDDIWQTCVRNPSERASLLNKLRWLTLGYHHNWDTKVYSLEDSSPFPFDLCQLTRYVSGAVGHPCYSPEAAIVNFYPLGSTLSGHTDHSELDHQSPIFSFSFGCTAIFLLGGTTKHTKPIPIYIRSGDVVAMFGPGRLNYHGVARIMSDSWRNSDVSCCHPPPPSHQLESGAALLNKAASSTGDSSSASASSAVEADAISLLTMNFDLHEKPSNSTSLASSDDRRSSRKRQCNSLCVKSTRGEGEEKEEEMGGYVEKDFCDDSRRIDELVTDYLKAARININVRQVFATSSSFSSSISSSSLSLNHVSQCIT